MLHELGVDEGESLGFGLELGERGLVLKETVGLVDCLGPHGGELLGSACELVVDRQQLGSLHL